MSWLTACASSALPASAPIALAPHEEEAALNEEVAPVEWHGIRGLFVPFPTWRAMLVRIELDKRDLEVALARSMTAEKIASDEAEQMRKAAAMNQWRATYGPWLGFAGGITVAAVISGLLGGLLR